MPKLKTHKGMKKRFKVSATGKVIHKKCGSSHLMSHKSGKQVRRLRKKVQLKVLAEARRIRKAVHTKPGGQPHRDRGDPPGDRRRGAGHGRRGRRRPGRPAVRGLTLTGPIESPWGLDRPRSPAPTDPEPLSRPNDACKEAARPATRAKKRLFKKVEGFVGGRRKLLKSAKETLLRAGMFAFRDRRAKKRDFRRLFITRLSAAAEMRGLRYSRFIYGLRLAGIGLDRKSLSDLAIFDAETFDAIADKVRAELDKADAALSRPPEDGLSRADPGRSMPDAGPSRGPGCRSPSTLGSRAALRPRRRTSRRLAP